ncbi:MAG: NCS2 family permease, partial [bacterium]
MKNKTENPYPYLVRKDIDGFFGLMIDNLIQLLLIIFLCTVFCGMPYVLVLGRILPGAAISILFGNIYYSYLARKLAIKTGRTDVTALPYGINTVSLFAYVFFIMAPVYNETGDYKMAWYAGLLASLGSGIIEFLGSFVAEWLRKNTPRAALLSTLAGIAITFIAMDFAFKIFHNPLVAMTPMIIILITYFSHLELKIPGGLLAVIVGTILAWAFYPLGIKCVDPAALKTSVGSLGLYLPSTVLGGLWEGLRSGYLLKYLWVIIPMGLFNVVGSLQNIESAEAAG